MVLGISFSCMLCFTLMQVLYSNAIQGEFSELPLNMSNSASLTKLGRSKRSLGDIMPRSLKIRVKYGMEEEIELNWALKKNYLANEHLPVITTILNRNPNVMSNVGEFVVYHDVGKCSAVVYFVKVNAFYGVIGINYYIESLPFDFDENGNYRLDVVGEPYVRKHDHQFPHIHPDLVFPPPSDTDAWVDFVRPNVQQQNLKRPSTCDRYSSPKHQRTRRDFEEKFDGGGVNATEYASRKIRSRRGNYRYQHFFSETLIFVARDIVEIFQNYYPENHLEWIVRYYIVYFNAVNMIFRKLEHPDYTMDVNIAKIVIEDRMWPLDFISNDELQFTDIVDKLIRYFRIHRLNYLPDSFDHVFIHTSRPILDDIVQVNGLTKHGKDLYEARKNKHFYDAVPISAVRFQYNLADYLVTVHEIGRTVTMKIDSGEKGLIAPVGQCYGLMQREGAKCADCLKWSEESSQQFHSFFNENRNRCFLLNKPRSLRPPGASYLITPNQQCRCFGYNSYLKSPNGIVRSTIRIDLCETPLQCQQGHEKLLFYAFTVFPFDGTPCSKKKVCWGMECVHKSDQE